ncbi:hypothetical protein CB0940_11167 [Cercospora beticola]|uniref:50S ribosomal protein L34 n=1 Tax=Cercospora beticola TaxID=122368 RepID=A0A2G5HD37_CERBT|nr:hypothetical protein CB0940_11167 [Cercospora beticola]PIA90460.1 hypothetical protein CB0940_11167 [Cercospora beticola]CAK1368147.1 unnamed protein product [Cercospora beticola]
MLCSRCMRATTSALRFSSQSTQRRSLSLLTTTLTRPALTPTRPSLPASSVESTTFAQPTSLTGLSISQVRGAKRDTYNPSHVVRKRRHGYLSRAKTRTGMMIIKRRRAKKRSTMSH